MVDTQKKVYWIPTDEIMKSLSTRRDPQTNINLKQVEGSTLPPLGCSLQPTAPPSGCRHLLQLWY